MFLITAAATTTFTIFLCAFSSLMQVGKKKLSS